MVEESSPNVIGISLGSVYSNIAVIDREGRGTCIANEDGDRQIPSYVAFSEDEEFAGSQAKAQAIRNPANTITRFRSLLGKSFDDPEVQSAVRNSAVRIVAKDNRPAFVVQYKGEDVTLTVREITTRLLTQLKNSAVAYTGAPISGAVLAVPIDATEEYRKDLLESAKAAGLTVLRLISEPAAAALGFGVGSDSSFANPASDKNVAVVDLGATSLNVSVFAVRGGTFTAIASSHDTTVGGEAVDALLVKHFAGEFKRKSSRDVEGNKKSIAKLTAAVETTKKTLTLAASSNCHVDALAEGVDFTSNINRTRFDMLTSRLFGKCAEIVEKTVADAKLKPTQIDEILLAGGCGRIPKLQSKIRDAFPTATLRNDVQSDEAISCGCALEAALLSSLPEEEVQLAAADTSAPHLSRTIGLLDSNGQLVPLIRRNTPLPAQRTLTFGKQSDDQTAVFIAVYEGEPPAPVNPNDVEDEGEEEGEKKEPKQEEVPPRELIVEVVLDSLPAGESGRIDVIFAVDAAGKLTVSAREKLSGKAVRAVTA